MKTFLRVALGSLLVGTALSASAPAADLVVKYKQNASPELINTAIGAKTLADLSQIGWRQVRLPAGMTIERGLRYYRSLSTVEKVDTIKTRTLFLTPNDPMYTQQYAPQRIGMPGAWEFSLGSSQVVVGVVDTGVRYTHADLASNLVAGGGDYGNEDGNASDGFGHGTAVSGCVSAVTNNGVGIAGTGWNVKVYNVKAFPDGAGSSSDVAISRGIMDCVNKGVRIINMSLGGAGASDVERDAVNAALNKGIFVVASAGNTPSSVPNYPASFPGVLSVGATDSNDKQSDFTSFGSTVDVAAPGVQVLTTDWTSDSSYKPIDGTSFSAPITAGALALMVSYAPTATNDDLFQAITSTTVNVGTWLNYGRINVAAAMAQIVPPVVTNLGPSGAAIVANEGAITNTTGASSTDASFVTSNDGSTLNIRSSYQPSLGTLAGFTTTFGTSTTAPNLSKLITGRLQVTLRAAANVTGLVMMLNTTTNSWDLVNSTRLTASNQTIDLSLPLPTLKKYINSSGNVTVRVRAINPSRLAPGGSPFVANVDAVNLILTVSSR